MIFCDSPTLEQWVAPPQEWNCPRPTWTRMLAGGVQLSNSIEFARWTTDPVEPIVCEQCWDATCARAGLARIVQLDDQVLWLKPRLGDIDEFWRDSLDDSNFIREAVLLPKATWDDLHRQFHNLPAAASFPRPTRRDLESLWLGEMPQAIRVPGLVELEEHLRRSALASDPLDLDQALATVCSLAQWLRACPEASVIGRIVRAETLGAQVNTLYFDGPPFEDWPAFVVGQVGSFGLGNGWVFLSGAGTLSDDGR